MNSIQIVTKLVSNQCREAILANNVLKTSENILLLSRELRSIGVEEYGTFCAEELLQLFKVDNSKEINSRI